MFYSSLFRPGGRLAAGHQRGTLCPSVSTRNAQKLLHFDPPLCYTEVQIDMSAMMRGHSPSLARIALPVAGNEACI
jgi:hypothetical protein